MSFKNKDNLLYKLFFFIYSLRRNKIPTLLKTNYGEQKSEPAARPAAKAADLATSTDTIRRTPELLFKWDGVL